MEYPFTSVTLRPGEVLVEPINIEIITTDTEQKSSDIPNTILSTNIIEIEYGNADTPPTVQTSSIIINEDGCYVTRTSNWMTKNNTVPLFNFLVNTIPWEQQEITIAGKKAHQQRLTCGFGDPGVKHKYSGAEVILHPWTYEIWSIKQRIEGETGIKFNSCLLNYYRNKNEYISFHADKEVSEPDCTVVTISLGSSRKFLLQRKIAGKLAGPVIEIMLNDGDELIMWGETQKKWQHSIPKYKKSDGDVGPRISLTFRRLVQKP